MSENTKHTGGAAFPVASAGGGTPNIGMTLRDYFAAKAMLGICAHPDTWGKNTAGIAVEAYEIADEMIAARTKE